MTRPAVTLQMTPKKLNRDLVGSGRIAPEGVVVLVRTCNLVL